MQRLLSQIGRSQRLAVLNLIKRTADGLTVREMAGRLKMSYMGVKQICIDLERDGYLETFRRNRGVGRPEHVYRLTNKARDLFPQADNALALSLLEQAKKLYGPSAAEKILFLHFQEKAKTYAEKIRGETPAERAKWLARLRDSEGCMADFESGPELRIIERHHPMEALFAALPKAAEMERDMFQQVLGTTVRRQQSGEGGSYECVYFVG
ncbi:MAG: helix-turn-helix transcriptional regulator [Terrimicrobiaceae bacterium]